MRDWEIGSGWGRGIGEESSCEWGDGLKGSGSWIQCMHAPLHGALLFVPSPGPGRPGCVPAAAPRLVVME